MENLIEIYEFDEDGFFLRSTFAQVDSVTREIIGMPGRCTTLEPELKDGFFAKFDGEKWIDVVKPSTAAECVGIIVSHKDRSFHAAELRKIFKELTEGSSTHRQVWLPDLSITVEEIPKKTEEEIKSEAAESVRENRDALIRETDFLMMPDYPISSEERQTVQAYRQALRDVPQQSGFPLEIDWPALPTVLVS